MVVPGVSRSLRHVPRNPHPLGGFFSTRKPAPDGHTGHERTDIRMRPSLGRPPHCLCDGLWTVKRDLGSGALQIGASHTAASRSQGRHRATLHDSEALMGFGRGKTIYTQSALSSAIHFRTRHGSLTKTRPLCVRPCCCHFSHHYQPKPSAVSAPTCRTVSRTQAVKDYERVDRGRIST